MILEMWFLLKTGVLVLHLFVIKWELGKWFPYKAQICKILGINGGNSNFNGFSRASVLDGHILFVIFKLTGVFHIQFHLFDP